jgi:hypothetical protein
VWAQQQLSGTDTPLYVNDTETGGRLLDRASVDPASLSITGRRVSWTSGGERRAAVVR